MTGEGRWTWLNGWELEASPDADRSSCSGRLCGLVHGLRPHFLTAAPVAARLDGPSACLENQIVNLGLMATDFPQYRLSFDRPE